MDTAYGFGGCHGDEHVKYHQDVVKVRGQVEIFFQLCHCHGDHRVSVQDFQAQRGVVRSEGCMEDSSQDMDRQDVRLCGHQLP